tara:strand:- start:341 stop:2251 length:1911 start_codon:yes stop_codon:yes gene_type:complete
MPTYYKYVERNAESQVNWAEVGKDITTMLDDETKIREEKKAAIQKAFQDDMEELANAPQGKWQDGNDTVNNFAHDMMEQQLIDNKLLKSGKMKPRDYTLRRENYKSQTNVLFDLQKTLQSERENTIDLYQKGKIQALNISNQADVEAYKNFKDRKAIINPLSANISMGLYEDQVVDGKTVRVLKNSTPVNVLMGQIVQKVPTLQIEEIMNKWVPTVGKQKDYIYQIATNSKAGSIVELMGVGALDNLEKEHPELKGKLGDYKKVIDDFNLSLTQQVKAWLPSPYQVASILTENLGGKYNADSYVWDENIAKADKTKILKKVDPLTGMVTLDENAPHYKEQKQEAEDWIRTSLLNKFDQERGIKVTSTTPYAPQQREFEFKAAQDKKKDISITSDIGALWGGSDKQIQQALTAFRDMNADIQDISRDADGVTVKIKDPNTNKIVTRGLPFKGADGNIMTQEEFIKEAAPLLAGNINAATAIQNGGLLQGAKFNTAGKGRAFVDIGAPEADIETEFANKMSTIPNSLFLNSKKDATSSELSKQLKGTGIIILPPSNWGGNEIKLKYKDEVLTLNSNQEDETNAETQKNNLLEFLEKLDKRDKKKVLDRLAPSAAGAANAKLPPCANGKPRDQFGNCVP